MVPATFPRPCCFLASPRLQLSDLAAALDMSGRALVASKRRMEALSCSMEELQQEMERDVSLLCDQLECLAQHRDALLVGGLGCRGCKGRRPLCTCA